MECLRFSNLKKIKNGDGPGANPGRSSLKRGTNGDFFSEMFKKWGRFGEKMGTVTLKTRDGFIVAPHCLLGLSPLPTRNPYMSRGRRVVAMRGKKWSGLRSLTEAYVDWWTACYCKQLKPLNFFKRTFIQKPSHQ